MWRTYREEAMAEELGREAGRRHEQQQVILGDPELDVLPRRRTPPVVERVDLRTP